MDLTTTLILALISIVIGFMLGSLVSGFRSGRNQETVPETEPDDNQPAEHPPGGVILLRRDPSGRLLISLDAQTLPAPQALTPQQRREMEKTAADLQTWLSRAGEAPSVRPSPAAPAKEMPPTGEPAASGQPDWNPLKIFERAISKPEPPAQPEQKSIASQVDEILQEKLGGTPLEKRAIRLLELPGQGMVVMIGLTKYTDLDQVPDPEIRALIHRSVTEWEQRMTTDRPDK